MDTQQASTLSTPTPDTITPDASTPPAAPTPSNTTSNGGTSTANAGTDTNGAGAPTRRWLNENVTPALLEGMKLLAKEKPSDPLKVLGQFLIDKSNESK
ncbi:similar to Saccharomyces cerevisiae YDR469W SDC1 Subunit of the COMPASS (Set1C) complex [Geotrichum candidum]|uniref:Similar to Saccharomyces cerevisiae YDR469W SDC1 Subunit of the COMPASS (Set1C) complex n=1 Tax=Geotrichum candidum TaxID=1173061 RepID=A0A0J9XDE1_GEOCN|nr:similar to Saccharomyces cerevisiae YDR469W SDC1 Subunit of the COMPASS (Set1C) complex [Geotrichum candidum]